MDGHGHSVGKLLRGGNRKGLSPSYQQCVCPDDMWICQCGAEEAIDTPRVVSNRRPPIWRRMLSTIAALAFFKPAKRDRRPRVDVKANGHQVRGLVDSGADLTCLQWEEFIRMKERPALKPYHNRLSTASGQPLHVHGVAPIKYQFGKTIITWDTVIVQNLRSPLILGIDFMEASGMILDAGKRQLTLRGGMAVKLLGAPGVGVAKKEYKVGQYEARRVAIVTREAPGTKLVAVGPWVDAGIIEVNEKSEADVLFYNRTCEEVTVRRNTPICEIEGLDLSINSVGAEPLEPGQKGYELPWSWMPPQQPVNNSDNSRNDEKYALSEKNLNKLMENIPVEYRQKYKNVIWKYADAFSKSDDDIGKCEVMPQHIQLTQPDVVVSRPPYRIPFELRGLAHEYVQRLLRQGVIVPSQSPFSSPLLLVKKPGAADPNLPVMSRYRIVHDYRDLNQYIRRQNWPLSDVHGLIDDVSQGSLVTCLDISSGFFNQLLTPESQELTAFSVSGLGHYMYTRSPMGIINSASAYQKLVQYVTQGIRNCLVFVDDLAIVTNTHEEHLETLEKVLQRFVRYGLKIRVSKLQLVSNEVTYMGFRISPKNKTIKPSALKTKAIVEWREPVSVKEIKQFVGLCSYFRRVCKDFSRIAQPLTKLTRKNSGYSSGVLPPEASAAFKKLQKIFSSEPTVPPVDYKKPFILITDASQTGAGAILVQHDDQGLERPVAFASKTWSEAESRRAPFHLEAAALIFGVRTFRCYLAGRHFVARSDHAPLCGLHKSSSPILDRIYAELEEFSFTMEHLAGKDMPADGLSRAALRELVTEPFENLSWERIRRLQEADRYVKALVCKLKYGLNPDTPNLRAWVEEMVAKALLKDGLVGIEDKGVFRILAPLDLRETLLAIGHDHQMAGHSGYRNTYLKLSQSWYWPGMARDCEMYCRSCVTCARSNLPGSHTKMPLQPLEEVLRTNARCHLDLVGPFPKDEHGNRYCMVAVDAFSNWVALKAIPSKETDVVADAFLQEWVCRMSSPETCVTDNGGEFDSKLNKELNKKLGITKRWTSAYHPQSNAVCERRNRDIVAYIRKFLEGNGDKWSALLPSMAFALNTSIHPDKKMSAYQIVYGQRPNLPTDSFNPGLNMSEDDFTQRLHRHFLIQDRVRKAREVAFEKQKEQYDKNVAAKEFLPGMVVYAQHIVKGAKHGKFQVLYDGPYTVVSVSVRNNVTIRSEETGRTKTLHANRLKFGTAREQWMKEAKPDGGSAEEERRRKTGWRRERPEGAGSFASNNDGQTEGATDDDGGGAGGDEETPAQEQGPPPRSESDDDDDGELDIFGTPVAQGESDTDAVSDQRMTRAGRSAAGALLPTSLFSDSFPKLK